MTQTYLAHHGVKGMKWGVRKDRGLAVRKFKLKSSQGYTDLKSQYKSDLQYLKRNTKSRSQYKEAKRALKKDFKKTAKSKYADDYFSDNVKKGVAATAIGIAALAGAAIGTVKVADAKYQRFIEGYVTRERIVDPQRLNTPFNRMIDDGDTILKKGTVFHRVTTDKNETIRGAKRLYAAAGSDDTNRYRAFMRGHLKRNLGADKVYDHRIKALAEVRSPSAKNRIKIFSEMLDEPDFIDSLGSGIKNEFYRNGWLVDRKNGQGLTVAPSIKNDKNRKSDFAKNMYYSYFAPQLCDRGDRSVHKYFDRVKAYGYNALVDDNDRGKLSQNPMILLGDTQFADDGVELIDKYKDIMARLQLKNF